MGGAQSRARRRHQDGISDSQADYFRRTIAELNDLTEDRIFVTRPIPAASSLDLNAYQGLDFAIVSPRVFALLERYNASFDGVAERGHPRL